MSISPELKAQWDAYDARPFAVHWTDSHFTGTFRFHTFDEAFAYAQDQWAKIRRYVARERYFASDLRWSYVETPEGRCPVVYYLMTNDVSSY